MKTPIAITWRYGKRNGQQHAIKAKPVSRYGRAMCGEWHPFTGWIPAGPDCVLPKCPKCQAIITPAAP
jgi:hypothetical protein